MAAVAGDGTDDGQQQQGAGDGDDPGPQLEEAAEPFEPEQFGDETADERSEDADRQGGDQPDRVVAGHDRPGDQPDEESEDDPRDDSHLHYSDRRNGWLSTPKVRS